MIIWEDTQKLNQLVSSVLENTNTDFYKNKYSNIEKPIIDSIEKLPFLSRSELVEVHPSTRCYVDSSEIAFVAYTSGTTTGKPLLTYFSQIENYYVDSTWGMEVSKLLVVFPPLNKNFSGTFVQQCRQSSRPVLPVFADISNLATSAYLAASTQCDALYATPTLALSLAHYLKEYYSTDAINFLAISGETIGKAKLASLQALYPNANIANLYASSEIGQFIMGPTKKMIEDNVSGFCILPEAVVAAELINGELVVTYGLNTAFPLIRYRTGDHFEVSEKLTRKYGDGMPVLVWSGKGGIDVVRVHGLELRAGSIDDFFDAIPESVDVYQLHVRAGRHSGTLIFTIECVMAADSFVGLDLIRSQFLSKFMVDSASTAQEALSRGLLESVHVHAVKEVSHIAKKRRVLVNHLE